MNITTNNLKIDIIINVTKRWQFKKIIKSYHQERTTYVETFFKKKNNNKRLFEWMIL